MADHPFAFRPRAQLTLVLAIAGLTTASHLPLQAQTTSPLEILQHAPKVRLDDERRATPPPNVAPPATQPQRPAAPTAPPPGYPGRPSIAPPIETVYPALTPYAGNSTRGTHAPSSPGTNQPYNPQNYYGSPAESGYGNAPNPTPTPRPVLSPQDLEKSRKKPKKGLVRGLINAIPFVGGKDDGDEVTPTPTSPSYNSATGSRANQPGAPVYRGYEDDSLEAEGPGRQAPLLLPPGSTPEPLAPQSVTPESMDQPDGPSSPPILTPEPRIPQPDPLTPSSPANPPADEMPETGTVDLDNAPAVRSAGESTEQRTVRAGSAVLTIKRESDDATSSASETGDTESEATGGSSAETAPTAAPSPQDAAPGKSPERAGSSSAHRLRPEDTDRVVIQETNSEQSADRAAATSPLAASDETASGSDSLGPEPDSSASRISAFDPTTQTREVTPTQADSADNDEITSLTIDQSDLGMPNPTYEQNATILAEFQDAVRQARANDYAAAAEAFRSYGLNHPSSGLAPRAIFLSVIFEKSKKQALENLDNLKHHFPKSRYIAEAEKRRGSVLKPSSATDPTGEGQVPPEEASGEIAGETPQQRIARLEKELTVSVGDRDREPQVRRRLALAYLKQQEIDRAYEVLRPAVEMSENSTDEAAVLLAMGRVLAARGEAVQAISLYEAVDEKHPGTIESDAESAWSVGLAFEGAGRYTKARTLYNTLLQKWPSSQEAAWATARLTELSALRR